MLYLLFGSVKRKKKGKVRNPNSKTSESRKNVKANPIGQILTHPFLIFIYFWKQKRGRVNLIQ